MRLYGLIGHPLTHSWSERYFNDKFRDQGYTDCQYMNFQIPDIGTLPELIKEKSELLGFNITIPYKEKVIPLLHELDLTASRIGAVNTVIVHRNESQFWLQGFNTDYIGFLKSLPADRRFRSALILGTGGAAKAVAFALRSLHVPYYFVSRNPKKKEWLTYSDLTEDRFQYCDLIINATPLGLYPHIQQKPSLPYEAITPNHFLFDLIYNPPMTRFLEMGTKQGASVMNGLAMLEFQAEESWNLWNQPTHIRSSM
jgi:shikimate dehydrogenase